MTPTPRLTCVHCRKRPVLIIGGTCERCKQELRAENRLEYYEAEAWEWERREARRRR